LFEIIVEICCLERGDACLYVFSQILHVIDGSTASSREEYLRLISVLIELGLHLPPESLICEGDSRLIRNIIAQGWRSSAEDSTRDLFLIACDVFLQHLSPTWTMGTDKASENSSETNFPILLVTIISNEHRILLHELVNIAELEASHNDGVGELERESDLNEPSCRLSLKKHQTRLRRILKIAFVCYDIFDRILELLIGSSLPTSSGSDSDRHGESESERDEEESRSSIPSWATLSPSSLLLIRQVYT
jgi:hypothetical protein